MANKSSKKKNTKSKNTKLENRSKKKNMQSKNTHSESHSKKRNVSNKVEVKENESKKRGSISFLDEEFMHIFYVVCTILIVFFSFYILTVYITKGNKDSSDEKGEVEISYSEIMAGRSFKMSEEDYLVLFYEFDNEELANSFTTAVTNYRSSDGSHYPVYYVNMSDAFNKNYASETSNTTPSDASDLLISGPTLIHFHEGSVSEYVEGESSIVEYLG